MAVRIATYTSLFYEGLIRSRQLAPGRRLPPVLPIVLYNGQERWTAPRDLAVLLADSPEGLATYRPRWPYLLIDEGRQSPRRLARMQNLVAALFRLEHSQSPEDIQRVLAVLLLWLREPEQESLRRAFAVWLQRVLLPARLPTVEIPEVRELVEVQSMLAERVVEWTQQWRAEGMQAGLQQGLQQGLAAERALLVRLARTRFGETWAQALAPLLEACTATETLADIGEGIVTAASGEALLAWVQHLLQPAQL